MSDQRRPWIADGADGTRVITRDGRAGEALGYFMHCRSLLIPGVKVPLFYDPQPAGVLPADLDPAQLTLVVDEARATLARQSEYLSRIWARAQSMVTVALTEVGLLAATAARFVEAGGPLLVAWILCFALAVLGLAGMASVASSRAEVNAINIGRLLALSGDLLTNYATELVQSVPLGTAVNAARQTVFRIALTLMALAGVAYGVLWLFTTNS